MIHSEFGGQGQGLATLSRVIEGIARGDAATALVLTMYDVIDVIRRAKYASLWQKEVQAAQQ